ncbi:leucine-rich repeat domain-containing protein [Kordia jejudonensis]|uniref:leucine-rich repeat domain-containing protein n=1 Tax=Kordia jejudonensis TaxID=1348245 RepID=UPI00069A3490|nr:leucine-rich repeat domain-containing protein [Kordia jejudonensis]
MSIKLEFKSKIDVFDFIYAEFGLGSEEYSYKFNAQEELTELDLSENELDTISGLSNLTTLERLYLQNNQLTDITSLSELTSLKILFLSNNQLNDISPLSKLTSLEVLDFSDNLLTDTTISSLSELVDLEELYLSNTQLTRIDFLVNFTSLRVLDISENKLTDISVLSALKSLKFLHLNANQISNIDALASLTTLSYVNLYGNHITDITPLANLKELRFLSLFNNKIVDLSPLEGLTSLEMLSIHDNPCVEEDIIDPQNNHIDFLNLWLAKNKLKDKIFVLLPKKVVFLGNHASGKSSLLHYLQHKNYAPETSTTHVLNVVQHQLNDTESATLKTMFSNISGIQDILPMMYYDFGGQDFYHGLYQSFSSKVAFQIVVYCADQTEIELVKDSKKYDTYKYPLSFWLKEKEYLEAGAKNPYFIVENKIDSKENNAFVKQYPNISDFVAPNGIFHVFLKALNEKNPLKEQYNKLQLEFLKKQLLQELYEPQEISKKVIEFYKEIYNDSILDELIIRNIDKYTSRIKGISEQNMLTQLQLLENSGVLFLSANQTEVIANPKAFIKYIHKNVLKKEIIFNKKGRLSFQDWKTINNGVHAKRVEAFMLKQKTMFIDAYTEEYIFPNYLPLYVQDEERYFLNITAVHLAFSIQFDYFIPFGFINVLIHHFGQEPNKKKFWRDAIYFIQHENGVPKANVFIVINIPKLCIDIHVEKRDDSFNIQQFKKYLWLCMTNLYVQYSLISWEEFKKIKITKSVGITKEENIVIGKELFTRNAFPKNIKVSLDGDYYISISKLEVCIDSNEYHIQLANTKKRTKLFPLNQFQLFTEKTIKKMKKIFISYSNADIYYKKELEKFLKPFQKFQLAKSWSCEEITPGLWDDQIQEELESSDIVIFMMSMNFASSDYILKDEVYNTFQQMAEKPEKKIVCVLVKQFPWNFFSSSSLKNIFNIKDGDISDADKAGFALANLPTNQFIPFYTDTSSENKSDHKRYLKPINQWKFEEEAYTQIIEILGKII